MLQDKGSAAALGYAIAAIVGACAALAMCLGISFIVLKALGM